MAEFKEISPLDLEDNVWKLIGLDYMLITAGNRDALNMMTASWGGVGVMWHKNVAFTVVRPGRYTKEFLDRESFFSLNFFSREYRQIVNFCGTHSGRDVNKIKETKLSPIFDDAPFFEEARLVFICKKLFETPYTESSFLDKTLLEKFYPENDLHVLYISEIQKVLKKD